MTTLTTETPENPTSAPRTVREPSVWRLCLSRGGVELRQFFREREPP